MEDMMNERIVIEWDKEKLESFKKAYKVCEREDGSYNCTSFTWSGHEFVPGYAKYLIEFLEEKLK